MKQKSLLLLTTLAGMLMMFSACQKSVEPAAADEIMGTPLPTPNIYCRIESIWENPGASDQKFRIIGYDQYENPTFISTPFVATGSPYRTFKYDGWHRLIQFREEFANGTFNVWHFYGFDLSGRIGVDTAYWMGSMATGQPTGYLQRTISWLDYDSQNRIIRSTNTSTVGPPSVDNYSYASSGNLVRAGVTYDGKVNLLRTNDIWMFLARDYSLNNPFTATAYNTTGFPMVINIPTFYRFANMDEIIIGSSQIGYACRQSFYH